MIVIGEGDGEVLFNENNNTQVKGKLKREENERRNAKGEIDGK